MPVAWRPVECDLLLSPGWQYLLMHMTALKYMSAMLVWQWKVQLVCKQLADLGLSVPMAA